MRRNLIVAWFAALALAAGASGCGSGGDDPEGTQGTEGPVPVRVIQSGKGGRFATITLYKGSAQPKIVPADKPPLQKVLIRDLRIGKGKVAHGGDKLILFYDSAAYKGGKRLYFRWPPQHPLVHRLADEPWEKALIGMKVGGQREVIVPSHLLFKSGTVDYIFELKGVD